MNLVNHLAERAELHPDRLALVDASSEMTYAELYGYVCGASLRLREDGLKHGDTLLILQPIGIPLYITILAAFHAGLTVMFIDPSAGKEMMKNSLTLHQPDAFIGTGKAHLLRVLISGIRKIPLSYHSSGWVPLSKKWQPLSAEFSSPVSTAPDAPALITFTSGSTSMPKAACRTHQFLLAQHEALAESLDYVEEEVDLVTLPIFALANLASGLTSVIADTDLRYPAQANAEAITKQCKQHRVTRCAASPAFFNQLHQKNMMPDFQAIYTGGAPVFPSLLNEIQHSRPEMKVVTVYGSTEAEPISHIPWNQVSKEDHKTMLSGQGLLVGEPVKATSLLIIPDLTGEKIPAMSAKELIDLALPAGQVGEIIVTGDHVLKGYLHGKGDEENKIHTDDSVWHRTGDSAWIDQNGRVWLMGRCSAKIQQHEKVIYPFGVECVAMTHEAVKRCALILHQDQATLFIEGEKTETVIEELQQLLNALPVEEIRFLPKIPVDKRHNSKIDYPELRKLIE